MATEDRPWLPNQLERCHNISMLFFCWLPEGYEVKNKEKNEHTKGYMKWFDHTPADLLEVHKGLYGDIIDSFFEGKQI